VVAALDPGKTADAITVLNNAKNWDDFRKAASLFEVPAQNLIYADVDGNIGYQSPGKIPVRGKGDGRYFAPGWDPDYDWTGYIPFEELPSVYNPAQGYLVTANQAVAAADYPRLLTTDWGDHGHLQPLPVSYLGLLLGAGFSWNVASAERATELDLAGLLDRHAFSDPTGSLGAVARDLGNAYREAGSLRPNSSVLFWALIKPERLFEPPGVTRETLEHTLAFVERASEPLAAARPALSDGPLLRDELGWARDALRFACRLGIERAGLGDRDAVRSIRNSTRAALARQLHELIERHRALWHARNRPGGLADSAGRLEQLLAPLL